MTNFQVSSGGRELLLLREEGVIRCQKNKYKKTRVRPVLEVAGHKKVAGGLEGSSGR